MIADVSSTAWACCSEPRAIPSIVRAEFVDRVGRSWTVLLCSPVPSATCSMVSAIWRVARAASSAVVVSCWLFWVKFLAGPGSLGDHFPQVLDHPVKRMAHLADLVSRLYSNLFGREVAHGKAGRRRWPRPQPAG